MFDPRIIFLGLWGFELGGQLLFGSVFDAFSARTLIVVFVAMLAFIAGAQFGNWSTVVPIQKKLASRPTGNAFRGWIERWSLTIAVIYIAIAVILYINIAHSLGVDPFDFSHYDKLRAAFVENIVQGHRYSYYTKFLWAGVGLALSLITIDSEPSKARLFAYVVLGVTAGFLTTGRLAILAFFIGTTYLLFRHRIVRIAGVVVTVVAFVGLFLLQALLMKKGVTAGGVGEQTKWNLLVYVFGGLSAFNHFVVYHEPIIAEGAFLPNAVRSILSAFAINLPPRPAVNPFIFMPFATNTYTALFPSFHDAGLAGTIGYFFSIGFLEQLLYRRRERWGPWGEYVYALSLYPLIMTIFEEAYVSSLGVAATLLIIPLFLKVLFAANRFVTNNLLHA